MSRARLILIPLLLLALLFTISCKGKAKADKKLIVVSIHPWELLLKELVGDAIEVRSIIPPDASPHTWSPKPSDLAMLQDADLVISNGLGLETNLLSAFEAAGDKHFSMVGLVVLKEEHSEHEAEAEHHHEGAEDGYHRHEGRDPHIWTSTPILLRATIALT
ncbi:MAG: metal ABC transporter substrate-binding protein, partial [Candidatus Cloacimonadaceae bacterium]|nr:metal ABC transporter substrate-binding protein [Candidatus Cloacimonadaceae bacterium]